MSAQTTEVAATRRSSTTYAQLTERAARCIARARVSALDETPGGGTGPNVEEVSAHRDLAAALVHLGGTLAKPLGTGSASSARPRRGGPDARLLRALEAVARAPRLD